jgi:hypothetical protein
MSAWSKNLWSFLMFALVFVLPLFLLPTAALASVNVTPDVIFSGHDVFQNTTVNIPIPSGITAGMLMVIVIAFENRPQTGVSITGIPLLPRGLVLVRLMEMVPNMLSTK